MHLFLKKQKVLVKYMSSSFMAVPVSFLTGFLSLKSIDPYYMGIWSTLLVFESYANFLRLGIVNGMNRELPFALGQGKKDIAYKFAETTLSYSVFNILLIILIAPFIIWRYGSNQYYIIGILVIIIRVIVNTYITYLTATFRSEDSFNKLSNIQFITIIINLLFCPLILFGYFGYISYQLISLIVSAALLHYYGPYKLKPKFHFPEFFKLAKIGIPIFITSYLITIIDTFPRLYIIKYSNEFTLGLYAPIFLILSTMAIVPNTFTTYIYPKFSYKLGENNNIKVIWKNLIKIYVYSFLAIICFTLIGFFAIDYIIKIFPKYKESLPYIKIALWICPFIFFKIGHMMNVIFKNYFYMILYVIVYAITQCSSLLYFSYTTQDVLKIVIHSQIITSVLMLIVSLIMNYRLIRKAVKPIPIKCI